ncbi:MAG: class I SAM-dependent methyltransferase [Flavobacteriaceae bacterium]|nr:class I SAM-dependent methyltransferase [Flavobacteriaceae bacterium]
MATKKTYLELKDHSVSQEKFRLEWHQDYKILCTLPQPNNLDKYYESDDYISHTDSQEGFLNKLYQVVRYYNLKKKRKYINSFKSIPGRLLDFGCGTGHFLHTMQVVNWDVSGYEPNEGAKNIAIAKDLKVSDPSLFWKDETTYDVISLWHVLEHLPDLKAHILQFKNLLNEDGQLLIAVPNFLSADAQYYKSYWAAYDVPRHLWHFSPEGICQLFLEYGFECVETKPMIFDAYYVSLLSEKYKRGEPNLLAAFYQAWRSNRRARSTKQYSSLIYRFQKC